MTIASSIAVDTFVPFLRNLLLWIDQGSAAAQAKGDDPAALTEARLIADMYPLSFQVQSACRQAEHGVAHLAGLKPPANDRELKTLDDCKSRVETAIAYVNGIDRDALDDARPVKLTMPNGIVFEMDGAQFLRDWALPQFYFHLVTAYGLLRQNGAQIGKPDYVRHAAQYITQMPTA